jgi:hypothetical protein
MARNALKHERIKALVAELLADEEADGLNVGQENINDIEDAMVRIGDWVAREVGIQKLACHTSQVGEAPRCPKCGEKAERVGERARELITRRGKVPLSEAKCRCPKCRQHFFPSDQSAGD